MSQWFYLDRAYCFPHCSCEAMTSDCVLCQPYAFASSAIYILVATFIYFAVQNKTKELKSWCVLLSMIGLTSFFAHASYTHLGLAMDMAAIINLHGYFLLKKIFPMKNYAEFPRLFMVFFLLTSVFYWAHWYLQLAAAVIIFFTAVYELHKRVKYSWEEDSFLIICIVLFTASFGLFIFDKHEWVCPLPILYGHTIWHIGTGISGYFFAIWYFDRKKLSKE